MKNKNLSCKKKNEEYFNKNLYLISSQLQLVLPEYQVISDDIFNGGLYFDKTKHTK